MGEELRPCPFCGCRNARLITNTMAAMSWVACPDCGLEAPTETGVSAEDAVCYWQTRTDPDHIAAIRLAREALEWFVRRGESLKNDIRTAHHARGAGASGWMREDDSDFRTELAEAIGQSTDALTHLDTLLQTKGDDRGEG